MRVPFVVYADFECFTKNIDASNPDDRNSYTVKKQLHESSGFCYCMKCFNDQLFNTKPVIYSRKSKDENLGKIFVERLEVDITKIYNEHKFSKPMVLTSDDEMELWEAMRCHICERELGGDKVRDHCHLTGQFRGVAHNECNLKYKKPIFGPVFFHNLSGYDAHLFIRSLGGELNEIPCNEEKDISFSKTFSSGWICQ